MGKKDKKYIQWYTKFTEPEDLIMHKFRKFLFDKGFIDSDTKYSTLKYCCLNTLWEYGDEVIEDFTYTEDELVELAEKHKRLAEKYREMLEIVVDTKDNQKKEVLGEVAQS